MKFDLLALDENFNVITPLVATNIQWRRKWFEAGTFSIEVPVSQYSKDIAYIYTKDRTEVGKITQVNYMLDHGVQEIHLSGYFLEEELNRMICYSKFNTSNIIDQPTWTMQKGKAEDVAHAYFNAFKTIKFDNKTFDLGIAEGENLHRGVRAEHGRYSETLGHKIYKILKPSGMSYRVNLDFLTCKKTFQTVKGRDLTQENTEQNNPVVFGTAFGNVEKVDYLFSDSEEKTGYIVKNKNTEENNETTTIVAGCENDENYKFLALDSSENASDYSTSADLMEALKVEGHQEVLKNKAKISFDIDTVPQSYEYLVDYDLGDVCTLSIPEIHFQKNAIISGCIETIKSGSFELTLEFEYI